MNKSDKYRIRLVSPWDRTIETDAAILSTDIPSGQADALLCEWQPCEELYSFPRRKAWYCCEPACQFETLQGGTWPAAKKRIGEHEFLHHAHPDPELRVPHSTHFEPLVPNESGERKPRGIAIVSNHGGSPHRRHPSINDRNRFITNELVDLYGRKGWKRYRPKWHSLPRPPKNYQGEIPGDWPEDQKRKLQASYMVSVCLENMCEPYYFTEKLVEAVMAGCIPVYRAHPTIRDTVLKGAAWVDPGDFDNDPVATIQHALSCDIVAFQEQNREWCESESVRLTHSEAVYHRIMDVLQQTDHSRP